MRLDRLALSLTALSTVALAPLGASAQTLTPAERAAKVEACTKRIKADPSTVKGELKMVTLAPAGSQWAKEFQGWTDDALIESDCRLMLRWYWNGGGGGDELRMVADLRGGLKHGAAMTAIGLGEIFKDVLVFQLPGLFPNWQALDDARTAERDFFEKEFAKQGFVIIGWGDVGAAKIMSVGTEVKVPANLKGKGAFTLTGDSISPIFFSKVGAESKPMGVGEVGSHLGKDIQIINIAPYAAEQLQLSSKVTHVTVLTTAFVIGALVVKKEKLDAMPADLRDIVLRTGKTRAEALTATIRNQDAEALKRMKQSKVAYTPSAEEQQVWKDAFSETRKSLRGAPFSPEVFDRVVERATKK